MESGRGNIKGLQREPEGLPSRAVLSPEGQARYKAETACYGEASWATEQGILTLSHRLSGGFRDGLWVFHEFPELVGMILCEYMLFFFSLERVSMAYIRLSKRAMCPLALRM